MIISNIDGLTLKDIEHEIDRGARFVYYRYCVSAIFITFKQPTDIFLVKGGESATMKGMQYTLISLVAGWWGIPWGPIYTIQSLIVNLKGGNDVSAAVMQNLRAKEAAAAQPPAQQKEMGAAN